MGCDTNAGEEEKAVVGESGIDGCGCGALGSRGRLTDYGTLEMHERAEVDFGDVCHVEGWWRSEKKVLMLLS